MSCRVADCVPVDRNGNKGRANETTAQIKSPDGKACLKFSAPSRGGSGLTMEPCNTDPQNCVVADILCAGERPQVGDVDEGA